MGVTARPVCVSRATDLGLPTPTHPSPLSVLPPPCLHRRRNPANQSVLQRTHLSTSVTAHTTQRSAEVPDTSRYLVRHTYRLAVVHCSTSCLQRDGWLHRPTTAAMSIQIHIPALPISPNPSSRFTRIGTEMTYSNTCDPARPPAESQRSITSQILIPRVGTRKKKALTQLTNPLLLYCVPLLLPRHVQYAPVLCLCLCLWPGLLWAACRGRESCHRVAGLPGYRGQSGEASPSTAPAHGLAPVFPLPSWQEPRTASQAMSRRICRRSSFWSAIVKAWRTGLASPLIRVGANCLANGALPPWKKGWRSSENSDVEQPRHASVQHSSPSHGFAAPPSPVQGRLVETHPHTHTHTRTQTAHATAPSGSYRRHPPAQVRAVQALVPRKAWEMRGARPWRAVRVRTSDSDRPCWDSGGGRNPCQHALLRLPGLGSGTAIVRDSTPTSLLPAAQLPGHGSLDLTDLI